MLKWSTFDKNLFAALGDQIYKKIARAECMLCKCNSAKYPRKNRFRNHCASIFCQWFMVKKSEIVIVFFLFNMVYNNQDIRQIVIQIFHFYFVNIWIRVLIIVTFATSFNIWNIQDQQKAIYVEIVYLPLTININFNLHVFQTMFLGNCISYII